MLAWEDYRLVLHIARARTLKRAAEALGVTLSTVFRRLQRIENDLRHPLFDRSPDGYLPTELGVELVRAAEKMEHEAIIGSRAFAGHEHAIKGPLRITSTESLATYFLAPLVPKFCRLYPDVTISLESSNRVLSLEDREADIAIRPRRPKEPHLVGRRIGVIDWGIYCAEGQFDQYRGIRALADIGDAGFLSWEASKFSAGSRDWIETHLPGVRVQIDTNSLSTGAELCAGSDMLAALPCFLGESWQGLVPVLRPIPGVQGEIWIVIHEDLRRNARVRAFLDFTANQPPNSGWSKA